MPTLTAAMIGGNAIVIRAQDDRYEFDAQSGLPEARGTNRQLLVVPDWTSIDARFDSIRIFDFKPDQPHPHSHTLQRNGAPVGVFTFDDTPHETDAKGIKFSVEFAGKGRAVTVDPGLILKP